MGKTTVQQNKAEQGASINREAIRAFIDSCKKPKSKITVSDFYRMQNSGNHEVWRKCTNCGDFFDLRNNDRCPTCQTKILKINKNGIKNSNSGRF